MENIQIRQKKIPDEVSEDYQTPSGSNLLLKATRETKEILAESISDFWYNVGT